MKKHPKFDEDKLLLTAEELRALVDYDPETGVFTWRRCIERPPNWNGLYAGKRAGYVNKALGRRLIAVLVAGKKRRYYAAVLAWLYMLGVWPNGEVDHKNLDKADDRWSNLRLADSNQNKFNLRGRGKSGFKGVSYDKDRDLFSAQITAGGKHYHLGRFPTAKEAHDAYCAAAVRLHGDFARTA